MIAYFDASSLVKYFIEEEGSSEVRNLVAGTLAVTSRITAVEIASALCRRCRDGHFSADQRDQLLETLADLFSELYVVEMTPTVVETANKLLREHRLRAGDAVQLASFLSIRFRLGKPVHFSAFDQRLIEAAEQATR